MLAIGRNRDEGRVDVGWQLDDATTTISLQ
jgi:hypothetical protein